MSAPIISIVLDVVVPFALMFSVIYGSIRKARLFNNEKIQLTVAGSISIFFFYYQYTVPFASILASFIVYAMITFFMFLLVVTPIAKKRLKLGAVIAAFLSFIVTSISVSYAILKSATIPPEVKNALSEGMKEAQMASLQIPSWLVIAIFLLIAFIAIIAWIAYQPKPSTSNKKSLKEKLEEVARKVAEELEKDQS